MRTTVPDGQWTFAGSTIFPCSTVAVMLMFRKIAFCGGQRQLMKTKKLQTTFPVTTVKGRIHLLRGRKVILDRDLAELYGVSTKALNQAVKRNIQRFPDEFVFRASKEETAALRSQIVTLSERDTNRSQIVTGSQKHRDPRFLPYAFSEHGALMAANVLRSPRAIQ